MTDVADSSHSCVTYRRLLLSASYRPINEVHLALLPVERIESNVELTRSDKAPSRWPLHWAVVVDCRTELAVGEVVVDRLGAVYTTSHQSSLPRYSALTLNRTWWELERKWVDNSINDSYSKSTECSACVDEQVNRRAKGPLIVSRWYRPIWSSTRSLVN